MLERADPSALGTVGPKTNAQRSVRSTFNYLSPNVGPALVAGPRPADERQPYKD